MASSGNFLFPDRRPPWQPLPSYGCIVWQACLQSWGCSASRCGLLLNSTSQCKHEWRGGIAHGLQINMTRVSSLLRGSPNGMCAFYCMCYSLCLCMYPSVVQWITHYRVLVICPGIHKMWGQASVTPCALTRPQQHTHTHKHRVHENRRGVFPVYCVDK